VNLSTYVVLLPVLLQHCLHIVCKQGAGTVYAGSTVAALHSSSQFVEQRELICVYKFTSATGGAGGSSSNTAAAGTSATTEPLDDGEGKYVLQIDLTSTS
jgi:hypothetical protein